jgi:hypothetical protein
MGMFLEMLIRTRGDDVLGFKGILDLIGLRRPRVP